MMSRRIAESVSNKKLSSNPILSSPFNTLVNFRLLTPRTYHNRLEVNVAEIADIARTTEPPTARCVNFILARMSTGFLARSTSLLRAERIGTDLPPDSAAKRAGHSVRAGAEG